MSGSLFGSASEALFIISLFSRRGRPSADQTDRILALDEAYEQKAVVHRVADEDFTALSF